VYHSAQILRVIGFLMMREEMIHKTLVYSPFNHLTQLLAWEYFSKICTLVGWVGLGLGWLPGWLASQPVSQLCVLSLQIYIPYTSILLWKPSIVSCNIHIVFFTFWVWIDHDTTYPLCLIFKDILSTTYVMRFTCIPVLVNMHRSGSG